MKKFITEKTCWHNGKYYEEGAVVECDCKFCKEGSVSYFKPLEEKPTEEKVSRETVVDEKKEDKKEVIAEPNKEMIEKKQEKTEEKPKKKNKIEIV